MRNSTRWTDIAVMIVSLIVIGISAWWLFTSGAMSIPLDQDPKLAWHLVRSAGIVSYVLLLASTVWGLFISGQIVKDWSPGPISMTLHATVSWLALLLGLGNVHELSMDPHSIPKVKKILRELTLDEARQLADKALALDTAEEIDCFIQEEMRKRFPYDFDRDSAFGEKTA